MSKEVHVRFSQENHLWLMVFLATAQEHTNSQQVAHKIADVCNELDGGTMVETDNVTG